MKQARDLLSQLLYRFANREHVARIQRHHVRLFQRAGASSVLDLGCGRGIFLELLQEAGIEGRGVDASPEVVIDCQRRGLSAELGEVLAYLEEQAALGTRYGGVFCSHLVEHLTGPDGARLIAGAASVLAPGGRLVVVTPNVANPSVWSEVFWLDPTHQRPYPRALLEAMMEGAGLQIAASFDDRHSALRFPGDLGQLTRHLLRHGLGALAGRDSVVVGDRPA